MVTAGSPAHTGPWSRRTRPTAPTTSDCSPGPAAAAAPAPPRPFIAAGRPRPQPGGFAFQSGGKPRGRESKGEARRARGFKRRQIAALSGRWMGQRAGDPEGAAWMTVRAQLRVPTPPSGVARTSPPPTPGLQVEKLSPGSGVGWWHDPRRASHRPRSMRPLSAVTTSLR